MKRKLGLASPEIAACLHSAWDEMRDNDDIGILCRTIMPDHIHVLMHLGDRLTLGRVVGKWKTRTRTTLKTHDLAWQRDFFERRLRPEDEQEPYGRYIFLNPYRAKLVLLNAVWPWWKLDHPEAFIFPSMLKAELYPQPEWLSQDEEWQKNRGW